MVSWHTLSTNWIPGGVSTITAPRQFLPRLQVLLLCGLLLACTSDLTSQEHLQKARELHEEKQMSAAVIELKNALRKDLQNGQARALLGNIYFDMGQYQDAEKELWRAYQAGEDNAVVVPALAHVLLGLREYAKLEQLNLDGLDPRERSIVQAAKGLAKLEQGDRVAASELLEAASKNVPVAPFALVAMARLFMVQEDYDKAREQLARLFKDHPKYMPAWNLKGDIESAEGQPDKAIKAYSKALKFKPRLFDARLNRALMYIYKRDFKNARKDLDYLQRSLSSVANSHAGYHFARGITLLQASSYHQARKSFQRSLEMSDGYPLSYYFIAVIDAEQEMYQRALISLYKFIALVPQSVIGPKLAAKLELNAQSYTRAEQLLQPVVAAYPQDIEALNLLAVASFARGKSDQGLKLLRRIAELQPESQQAQVRLGAGLLAVGKTGQGMEILQDILDVDPGFEQADVLIALTKMRRGNAGAAVSAAKAYRDRNPTSATSYNLLAQAYLDAGDDDNARLALTKVLELQPGDPAANIRLAEYSLDEQDYDQARQYYQRVLEAHPKHLNALMKIASSYAREGREQEMAESIEHALQAEPWALEPRLMKARYYIAKGQLREASETLSELTSEQRKHPDTLFTQAGFELAAGRYNHALVSLRELMLLRPDVAQHYYMRSKAYAGLGWDHRVDRELKRTLELDPQHFYALMALARLALSAGNDREFGMRLAGLKNLAPDNADVMKLEVIQAQKEGRDARATQLLEILYQRNQSSENLVALAEQRYATGDKAAGIAILEDWVEERGDDLKARASLASLYRAEGRQDDLVEQYLEILERDEEHIVALNNLGWYLLDDEPKEALEYARRAHTLYPESGLILDTLALAQLRNGRVVEARRNIDRALKMSPDTPELRFHEIQIRVEEGEGESARADLLALLQQYPRFSERDQAEILLLQID